MSDRQHRADFAAFMGSVNGYWLNRSPLTPKQRDEIKARWAEERLSDTPPTKQGFSMRMAVEYNVTAGSIRGML